MKNQKGITLIALVITIIVLLILAGVSIAMLTGDNGILTRANSASMAQIEGQVSEEVKLAVQAAKMFAEEMSTKTSSGWLAGKSATELGATSTDDTVAGALNVVGQMRSDLTTTRGYTEIKAEVGTPSKITVTYTTPAYQKATNNSFAKIVVEIEVSGNVFKITNKNAYRAATSATELGTATPIN